MATDNLITNGDFQDLSGGTGPSNTPTGWAKTGHASGVFNASSDRGDGYAYALGGWSGVGGQTLSQEVDTSMGQIYELTFEAAANYGTFTGNLKVVADSPDGEIVLLELSDADLGSPQAYTARFAAQGTVTNIRFIFDGDGGGDIDLDNISLHQANSMSVSNGSLEAASFAEGGYAYGAEGWERDGSSGTWNPTTGHYDDEAPAGETVGWINSGSVSQVLAVPYNSAKTYEIDLMLGGRKGQAGSEYEIVLMAGDTVIGTTRGTTTANGTWEPVTVTAPFAAAQGLDGEPLKVVITKLGGGQLNHDDVSISVAEASFDTPMAFALQNHNSDVINPTDYGIWLKGISSSAETTFFDFEADGAEMFMTVAGDTITIEGTAVARTQLSDGSFQDEGTFRFDFTYENVSNHPTDNDLVVLPAFDGTPVGTISRLNADGDVIETFDYTSKSGSFGGFSHSLRLGDGFQDQGGPWSKPGISVDAWLSTDGISHAGDFHFTLGQAQLGTVAGRYFLDNDGSDVESAGTTLADPSDAKQYTIEAEDMALNGAYTNVNVGFASGTGLIQTWGTGTATTTFNGEAGTYTLELSVLDETDGNSTINIIVNGEVVETVVLDQPGPAATAGINVGSQRTISIEDVQLDAGDVLTLEGIRGGGEAARIDKIDLIQTSVADDDVEGMTVVLFRDGAEIERTLTDENGDYTFEGVELGDGYQVAFQTPGEGLEFVTPNVGGDDSIDSDVTDLGADFGTTSEFSVDSMNVTDVDAGIRSVPICVEVCENDEPEIYDFDSSTCIFTEDVWFAATCPNLESGDWYSNHTYDSTNDSMEFFAQLGISVAGEDAVSFVSVDSSSIEDYFSSLDPSSVEYYEYFDPTSPDYFYFEWDAYDVGLTAHPDPDSLLLTAPDIRFTVILDNGETVTRQFCVDWQTSTPIALDLNGNGQIDTTGSSTVKGHSYDGGHTVWFDLDADGVQEKNEWMDGSGDALLIDTSKVGANNQIDGNALFGDQGVTYANGYDKLAELDANGDGKVSGAEVTNLALWVDDGDGRLEDGELQTLADNHITQLSTMMVTQPDGRMTSHTMLDAEAAGTVEYSLSGADAHLFDVSVDGKITWKHGAPDFESPLDADGDNIYDVTLVRGGAFCKDPGEQDLRIKVQDKLELQAEDDCLFVTEDEAAGDIESLESGTTSILANDSENAGAARGGVVTVDGASGTVGDWIDLDKGRVKIRFCREIGGKSVWRSPASSGYAVMRPYPFS